MESEELSETRPTSPEPMLRIVESIRFFKVMHQIFLYNPFKTFNDMRSQCNWSVIYRIKCTFVFEKWRYQGMFKCTWDFCFSRQFRQNMNKGIEIASLYLFGNRAEKPSNPAAAVGFKLSIPCAMSAMSNLMSSMVTGTSMFEEVGFSEGTV